MFKNNRAFTFVELIVVITIMTILATIGFVVYKDYLSSSYDSNRIQQLSDIKGGLELLSVNTKLPYPDDKINISASGGVFAYQGNAGDTVVKTIGYDGGGIDPEFNTPFTYMITKGGKNFQLMGFIKEASFITGKNTVFASNDIDYSNFFPKVVGDPLGIIIDAESQEPIHLSGGLSGGGFDIRSGANIKSYLSDTNILTSKDGELHKMLPASSCLRILELGNSEGSGEYILSFPNTKKQKTYCDMDTQGGGWTLIARSRAGSSLEDFGWLSRRGNIGNKNTAYSFGSNVKDIYFSEILFTASNGIKWTQSLFDSNVVNQEISTELSLTRKCKILQNSPGGPEHKIPCYRGWGNITKTESFQFNAEFGDSCSGERCSGMRANGYAGRNIEGVENRDGEIFIR